jgi:ankyrin repeat protein
MANSSLYEAVEENDVGKAMELLQNGADVNSRGGVRNLSVLTKACITGNCKMVALLLANNASVNTSESITTALLSAARENHTDIVELLLQKKVDVNQTDKVSKDR